jgi:hypothetical protein
MALHVSKKKKKKKKEKICPFSIDQQGGSCPMFLPFQPLRVRVRVVGGCGCYQEACREVGEVVRVLQLSSEPGTGIWMHWRMSRRQMGHFSSCRAHSSQKPLQRKTHTPLNLKTKESHIAAEREN